MAKKLDFDKEKNNRNDNVIEEIMQADFPLPKQAEDAKNEAFSRIREMAAASGHTENTENMVLKITGEINRKFRKEIHRNSKIAQEIQNSIQNSFGTDCSCSCIFNSMYHKSGICREHPSGWKCI